MPWTLDPEITYYQVLRKDGDAWKAVLNDEFGGSLHETLDTAMEVAKELGADGVAVKVRRVYVSWSGRRRKGVTVYRKIH